MASIKSLFYIYCYGEFTSISPSLTPLPKVVTSAWFSRLWKVFTVISSKDYACAAIFSFWCVMFNYSFWFCSKPFLFIVLIFAIFGISSRSSFFLLVKAGLECKIDVPGVAWSAAAASWPCFNNEDASGVDSPESTLCWRCETGTVTWRPFSEVCWEACWLGMLMMKFSNSSPFSSTFAARASFNETSLLCYWLPALAYWAACQFLKLYLSFKELVLRLSDISLSS